MRVCLVLPLLLLSPLANAQKAPVYTFYGNTPETRENIEQLRKGGATIDLLDDDPQCASRLEAVAAEQAASDEAEKHKRVADLPLRDQYEQEIYYSEIFAKAFREACLKGEYAASRERFLKSIDSGSPAMTRRACAIVAEKTCKGVKHW